MVATILIVDDEADIRELLSLTVGRMSLQSKVASSINEALAILEDHSIDLCLTDLRLPDGNGLELVENIQKKYPKLPVAVLTAYGSVEVAVQALKLGAFDFITKPINIQSLRDTISNALKLSSKKQEDILSLPNGQQLIGKSPVMKILQETIKKVSRSQAPVYIHGESGTGKELIAKLIHHHSTRQGQPFIPINCGAIPPELLESEFFGHKKGSFTGAQQDKIGLFQAAHGGTLFLDEIADLPLHMQVKLLRTLQEKTIRPIGSTQEMVIDVRIISASHKNLHDMITKSQFREDLYYRINVIQVKSPSLRERAEDIPLLTEYLLNKIEKQQGTRFTISEDALEALCKHPFRGNVRELENALERAAALCENAYITEKDLALPIVTENARPEELSPLTKKTPQDEKERILAALDETRWNRQAAAKKLGITARQLRYRMQKLGLN
jgi:two-component system response regulator PilR (NtrC family)